MSALAKAIGQQVSGMCKAWKKAMEKASPSAQRVCFKFQQRELVFYKEVDSGKN